MSIEKKYSDLVKKLSNPNTGEMPDSSFKAIKDICKIVNPNSILEIGFNRGSSALMWLLNSKAHVTSIDIRTEQDLEKSLDVLKSNFKDRFNYYEKDAYKELPFESDWVGKFDLIFIDCWHVPLGYELDTKTAMFFGSPYIAYDDYLTHSESNFIRNFVEKNPNLKEIKTYSGGFGQSLVQNVNYLQTRNDDILLDNIKNMLKENEENLKTLKNRFNYARKINWPNYHN